MDNFRDVWSNFDPEGTYFIEVVDILAFLSLLGEPFGFSSVELAKVKLQLDYLRKLDLPTY